MALAAVVLLGGCGLKPGVEEQLTAAGRRPDGTLPIAGVAQPPRTGSAAVGRVPGGSSASGGPVPVRTTTASSPASPVPRASASRAPFPLAVAVSPPCVAPGGQLTVDVRTRPHSAIAHAIGYSDSQAHGSLGLGQADGAGRYSWRVVVPLDAPPGEAKALVSAQDRSGPPDETGQRSSTGEGASSSTPFTVARDC